MVRTVAGWDPARAAQTLMWPLRDLLLAYLDILRREAMARYERDLLVWAALAPHQKNPQPAPKPPKILRGA